MEIERKFTIKSLPENLADYPCHIHLGIPTIICGKKQMEM